MAPMPVPPDDGGNDHVSGLPQGLRLSEVEEIAAGRLDGAAEGSLREALAIASVEKAGGAESPPIAIEAVGESFAAGPLVRLIDARFAEAGRTQIREPFYAFSPMPRPPAMDFGVALATRLDGVAPPPLGAVAVAPSGPPALTPSADWQGFAGDGEPAGLWAEDRQYDVAETPPAAATGPLPHAAAALSTEPLASALDAAARLAADASVAAETLENLKRLLEHKQQLESQLTQLAAGSPPAPASDDADVAARAPSAPLPPLPLPLHAEQDAAGESPARPMVLPPPPRRRRRAPPERLVFDVRGFMAGFALSWAFGVVLYLFMTAG
jgi:hypothetical protein